MLRPFVKHIMPMLAIVALLAHAPAVCPARDFAFGYKGVGIHDRLDETKTWEHYAQCLNSRLEATRKELERIYDRNPPRDSAFRTEQDKLDYLNRVREEKEARFRRARESAFKRETAPNLVIDTLNKLNYLDSVQKLIQLINTQDSQTLGTRIHEEQTFTTLRGNCVEDQDAAFATLTKDGRVCVIAVDVRNADSHEAIRSFLAQKYGQPISLEPPTGHTAKSTALVWGDERVMAVLGDFEYHIINMGLLEETFRHLVGSAAKSGERERQAIADLFE